MLSELAVGLYVVTSMNKTLHPCNKMGQNGNGLSWYKSACISQKSKNDSNM